MRGLAGFAMEGRSRALLLAIATAGSLLFAWIAAALVALVTLRKGYGEGLQLLLWASLPGLILARVTGDGSVLALVVGTAVLAFTLRASMSLALTALASVAVALLTSVLMVVFGEAILDELVRIFSDFLTALEEQQNRGAAGSALALARPTPLQIAGMLGTANGTLSFLCLALARYWQAGLYNPGGFGEEFRALRFPPALVWVLVLVALGIASLGFTWRSWAAAFVLPLTIAGFALLHARAVYRGRGRAWMGAIYVAWAIFDAAKLALIGLVLADSFIDFRGRWPGGGDGGSGSRAAKEERRKLDADHDASSGRKDADRNDDRNRDSGPDEDDD